MFRSWDITCCRVKRMADRGHKYVGEKKEVTLRLKNGNTIFGTSVCVCVCVFFPFILDVMFVGCTSRGHTGERSNRILHPPSFCGACLYFSREKDSDVSFPRRQ